MHGLPTPGTVNVFSFCVSPTEYTIHAIDEASDGWWGGAYYSVRVNGTTVVNEQMGHTSSSRQNSTFTVSLPSNARTVFVDNKALAGGGGAVFWKDQEPENTNRFRNSSVSNTALFGNYAATPVRSLSARKQTYTAVSGNIMNEDPITIELKDWSDSCRRHLWCCCRDHSFMNVATHFPLRYGQTVTGDDSSALFAKIKSSNGTLVGRSDAICLSGEAAFSELAIDANPGAVVWLEVSLPSLLDEPITSISVAFESPCPLGTLETETINGNVVCSACDVSTCEHKRICEPCPRGVLCDRSGLPCGQTDLEPGYWRAGDGSIDVRECGFGIESCPSTNMDLADRCGAHVGDWPYCGCGYVGPLCAVCAPMYFLTWAGRKCQECGPVKNHASSFAFGSVLVLLTTVIGAIVYSKRKALSAVLKYVSILEQLYAIGENKLQILFYLCQVRGV